MSIITEELVGKIVRSPKHPRNMWWLVVKDIKNKKIGIVYLKGHSSNGQVNFNRCFSGIPNGLLDSCEVICDLTDLIAKIPY